LQFFHHSSLHRFSGLLLCSLLKHKLSTMSSHAGGNKFVAGVAVFFISGALHEMAVGVPLRMTRYWAFAGMMAQIPMIFVTEALKKHFKNEVVGNIIFWLSFCIIGQPICALLYYHDFLLEHSPQYLDGLKQR
jgi:hypothetical protein